MPTPTSIEPGAPAPPDRFAFFADVPELAVGGDEPPTSRVQIAKIGTFRHPRYGTFTISAHTFDRFIANFEAGLPTDRLPVDFDHEPDMGGSSRACGWITRLDHDGRGLFAAVRWTRAGEDAIRAGEYRYVSPTWSLNWVDESGEKRGPTLLAFGLTNRPYFSLPAVSLSQTFSLAELDGGAELAVEVAPEPLVTDIEDLAGTFELLVSTGVLEEGHRRMFDATMPGYRLLLAEGPHRLEQALQQIRRSAETFGHVPRPVTLASLDEEVRGLARDRGYHWWDAIASLLGEPSLAQHAPPPLPPPGVGGHDPDMRVRAAAHAHEISYMDAAELGEYDRAINAAGYDVDRRARLRADRDEHLARAQRAEVECREAALTLLRARRGPSRCGES